MATKNENRLTNKTFTPKNDLAGICKLYNGQREIELLILIFTMHNNIIQRNALRDTWLTHSKNNSANVRYVFLLGKAQNSKLEKSLIKESEQFGDIIQENFVDVYRNLTFKTIMGLNGQVIIVAVLKLCLKLMMICMLMCQIF